MVGYLLSCTYSDGQILKIALNFQIFEEKDLNHLVKIILNLHFFLISQIF